MIRKIDSNKFSLTILKVTTFSRIRHYAETYYLGRNKVYSTLSCFRYEAVEKKIMIGTRLVYWTKKGKKASNDEL